MGVEGCWYNRRESGRVGDERGVCIMYGWRDAETSGQPQTNAGPREANGRATATTKPEDLKQLKKKKNAKGGIARP